MAKPRDSQNVQAQMMKEIQELRLQVAQLTSMVAQPVVAPRYPMWALIRDHLKTVGGSATPVQIAESLMKAGHKLGKYPLRNVKITVTSPMMKSVFRVTENATGDETVALIDRPVPFSVKKWVDKKLPKR